MELNNLTMLAELARTSRDAAAAQRARLHTHLEQARTQLAVLRGYASDYDRRGETTLREGCDIAAQTNLRVFSARLHQAIEAQQLEVRRREQALAAADEEFLQHQRRLKSLETLAVRKREAARSVAARREQKTTDEVASTATGGAERPLAAARW